MKVVVLGGGVIGVTSAWYLAKAGHEVIVIDRQMGVGRETSFANAGEISPGYASPWAAPGIPVKALKWLLMRHPPLILRGPFDLQMLRWLAAMLRNCTEARYSINKSRMVRLAEFSRDRLIALRAETSIAYDERTQGTLQLFRTQKQIDDLEKDLAVLRAGGVPFEQLDREGCIKAEPGLAAACDRVIGGLRLPNDETGDCFKFTEALASLATRCGVTFQLQTTIQRLEHMSDRIVGVHTDQGFFRGDAYLVALGSSSPQLLQPLGMSLPVYPVKGYSITLPVKHEDLAPVSTIMDETYKIAITRLGSRIRVGGMAELSGFDTTLPDRRRQALLHSLTDLFPGATEPTDAVFWSGLRPMTPDGTPIIGVTAYSNLFLNTGHGTLGWTMACGSGHIIADIVSGIDPAIATRDLAIARYAAS